MWLVFDVGRLWVVFRALVCKYGVRGDVCVCVVIVCVCVWLSILLGFGRGWVYGE